MSSPSSPGPRFERENNNQQFINREKTGQSICSRETNNVYVGVEETDQLTQDPLLGDEGQDLGDDLKCGEEEITSCKMEDNHNYNFV